MPNSEEEEAQPERNPVACPRFEAEPVELCSIWGFDIGEDVYCGILGDDTV